MQDNIWSYGAIDHPFLFAAKIADMNRHAIAYENHYHYTIPPQSDDI